MLLPVVFAAPLRAQTQPVAPPDPYATYSGDAIPWPGGERKLLTVQREQIIVEGNSLQHWAVRGGPNLALGDIRPFVAGQPIQGTSLVFQDSRAPSGKLIFTVFKQGEFLPSVDEQSLMGYAKAIVLSAGKEETVTIIDPPGSELDRKQALLREKPLFITWQRTDNASGAAIVRTDYFFEIEEGLLVVTVAGDPRSQGAVRDAAERVMRFGYFE